ncbi:MAG: calcium/sodium antiporter [Cytophagales bacterium]|nr:calcium/sodium antiporter [Cytophagales bacterium]
MMLNVLLLVIGFVTLIKGADFLVDGASSVARRYGISELAIGLTIVAFGTSAPELVVSVISGINGHNEVALGNVIGSNIFNLLLILGVTGLVYPLTVQGQTVQKEIPLSLLAAIMVFFLANDQFFSSGAVNQISRWDSAVLLVFFFIFMAYVYSTIKPEEVSKGPEKTYTTGKAVLFIVLGLVGLIFGGKLVVDNAVEMARDLGMSEKLIGLTIVAVGTSLPELATSVVAALKKNSDIAVGNIIGSNIFNVFFILGISGLVLPIAYNPALNLDIYILMGATVMLYVFMYTFKNHKLDRVEAGIMLACYLVYSVFIFWRN